MGNLERRLENLERLVEGRVEARLREELKAAIEKLDQCLPNEEFLRVARILASEEEEPQRGAY
jgi:hypothetical protein